MFLYLTIVLLFYGLYNIHMLYGYCMSIHKDTQIKVRIEYYRVVRQEFNLLPLLFHIYLDDAVIMEAEAGCTELK